MNAEPRAPKDGSSGRSFVLVTAFLLLMWAALPARALPTGAQVLQRVRSAGAGVRDYAVDVEVHFDVAGMRVPDAVVRLFHKRPDKTKLQPVRGFAIVPKGALFSGDPLAGLGESFSAKVLGTKTLAGRPAYHLRLVPRDGGSGAPVEAWVDRERWTLLKLMHRTPDGEPVTLDIAYERQSGKFWLPSCTVARLRMPAAMPRHGHDPTDPDDAPAPGPAQGEGAPPPAPRAGTVTATFRNYRVNTGLPDSLFKEEPKARPQLRRRGMHGPGSGR